MDPLTSAQHYIALEEKYNAHNYHPLPVVLERGQGVFVWDVEGKRYIDFAAGIAVVNTGHRHPRVMDAVKKQLDLFTHTCHQVVPYENYVELAERLNKAVPGNFAKKTIFVSTGAEAVENAIKIARAATGRRCSGAPPLKAQTRLLDHRTRSCHP